jgi:hypothetical protein
MPATLTPEEALHYATEAKSGCAAARAAAPINTWAAQWDGTAVAVQTMQLNIENPPPAWQVFWPAVSDAVWGCAYATARGEDFGAAFASLMPTIEEVTAVAKAEFATLMTIQ